jgi:hypothetical protein
MHYANWEPTVRERIASTNLLLSGSVCTFSDCQYQQCDLQMFSIPWTRPPTSVMFSIIEIRILESPHPVYSVDDRNENPHDLINSWSIKTTEVCSHAPASSSAIHISQSLSLEPPADLPNTPIEPIALVDTCLRRDKPTLRELNHCVHIPCRGETCSWPIMVLSPL